MLWNGSGQSYSAQCGEYDLRVWLDPNMPIPNKASGLGSDEHPFVWLYEVRYEDGTVDFRGVRETLLEAQNAAAKQVWHVQPDVLDAVEGF